MQEKSTFKSGCIKFLTLLFILILGVLPCYFSVFAQTNCTNQSLIFSEDFGYGQVTSNPDVVNISYSPGGGLEDGNYRVFWHSQQRPEWHYSLDHTTPSIVGNRMLIVNGQTGIFYSKTLTSSTGSFVPGFYAASLFLMNLNTPGTCAPNPLLPTIIFNAAYNTQASGNEAGWVQLQSVTATSVPQSATPTWIKLGGVFALPNLAQRIRLTIVDGDASGCGNDYAIDDILFTTCPDGGPLPVEFLNVTAIQKGGGVTVNWSTASESNNKYFDVEKSTDGANWTTVNSLNTAGNSSISKNYSSYDATPVAGYNYYRIKQVDNDGKFKYSSIAKVKISIEKTGVTVLSNPFITNITVDFLSKSKQAVNVKLTDMAGKVIAIEKWQIANGSTRLSLNKVANIQKGMYIFTVIDDNGAVIFNSKLIKQ